MPKLGEAMEKGSASPLEGESLGMRPPSVPRGEYGTSPAIVNGRPWSPRPDGSKTFERVRWMVFVDPPVNPSRTENAKRAVHLSDLLALKFARVRFGTEVPRYLRVTEPDGPRTDGGRKARQAILLCPQREGMSSNMVCGFIDVARQRAELRSYAVVKAHFERRHQRPVDITRSEYNRMVDLLQTFLETQSYETRVTTTPTARAPSPAGRRHISTAASRPRHTMGPALSFLLGFLACYLLGRIGGF